MIPVLHKGAALDVNEMSDYTSKKIDNFFLLDENNKSFMNAFNDKKFIPEILFDGLEVEDVRNHPMGIWRTR